MTANNISDLLTENRLKRVRLEMKNGDTIECIPIQLYLDDDMKFDEYEISVLPKKEFDLVYIPNIVNVVVID